MIITKFQIDTASARTQEGNVFQASQMPDLLEAYQIGIAARQTGESLRDLIYGDAIADWVFNCDLANLFFEAGFQGLDKPELVTGYRYGKFSSKSYNYRDNKAEAGVSCFAIEGQDQNETVAATSELFFGNKQIYKVVGFLSPKTGSDGEPLVVPCWV